MYVYVHTHVYIDVLPKSPRIPPSIDMADFDFNVDIALFVSTLK